MSRSRIAKKNSYGSSIFISPGIVLGLVLSLLSSGCSPSIAYWLNPTASVSCDTSASLFSGGSGTSDDPYVVCNAHDLDEIRNHLDKNFILANDIDLTGETLYPIPRVGEFDFTSNPPPAGFSGVFDGNQKTISNWNVVGSDDSFVGLFSFSSGTIKNLTIQDFSADLRTFTFSGGYACAGLGGPIPCFVYGGLVAYNGGTLSNITINGSRAIQTDSTNAQAVPLIVGGLVGAASGTIDTISMNVSNGFTINGGIVGGLFAYVNTGAVVSNITYNQNQGIFSGSTVGGVAGLVTDDATSFSHLTATITSGQFNGTAYMGDPTMGAAIGQIGNGNDSTQVDQIEINVSGHTVIEGGDGANVGGAIGQINSHSTLSNLTVTISGTTEVNGGDGSRVGGAMGQNQGTITTANITVDSDVSLALAAPTSSSIYAGGIVGVMGEESISGITASFAGTLTAPANATSNGVHLGGFIGQQDGSSILDDASFTSASTATISLGNSPNVHSQASLGIGVVLDAAEVKNFNFQLGGTINAGNGNIVGGGFGELSMNGSTIHTGSAVLLSNASVVCANDCQVGGVIGNVRDQVALSDVTFTVNQNATITTGTYDLGNVAVTGGVVGSIYSIGADAVDVSNVNLVFNGSVTSSATAPTAQGMAVGGGIGGVGNTGAIIDHLTITTGSTASVTCGGGDPGNSWNYAGMAIGRVGNSEFSHYIFSLNGTLTGANDSSIGAAIADAYASTFTDGTVTIQSALEIHAVGANANLGGFIGSTDGSLTINTLNFSMLDPTTVFASVDAGISYGWFSGNSSYTGSGITGTINGSMTFADYLASTGAGPARGQLIGR